MLIEQQEKLRGCRIPKSVASQRYQRDKFFISARDGVGDIRVRPTNTYLNLTRFGGDQGVMTETAASFLRAKGKVKGAS